MRCRNMFALTLSAGLLAAGCDSGSSSNVLNTTTTVFGSGIVVEEDRPVAGFDTVTHASEGNLHVEMGAQESLRIRAEDNLLPHILSDVTGSSLDIHTRADTDLEPSAPIEFFLTVKDLSRLELRGVGDVELDDLSGDQLRVVLGGVGDIDIDEIDVGDLDLELRGVGGIDVTAANLDMLDVIVTGVGDVGVSGTADEQRVDIDGLGDYDGTDLATVEAEVLITGTVSATVRVSDTLTVSIVGSGSVFYIGDPTVNSTIVGGGTVQQIPG